MTTFPFGFVVYNSFIRLAFTKRVYRILNIFDYPTMDDKSAKLETLFMRLEEADKKVKDLSNEIKLIRGDIAVLQKEIRNEKGFLPRKNLRKSILLNSVPSASNFDETPSKRTKLAENVSDSNEFRTDKKSNDASLIVRSSRRKRQSDETDSVDLGFQKSGDYVVVYTDGACSNNGKPGAKAGIGVWFGDNHRMNISKPVEGKATNNAAEIQACIAALKVLKGCGIEKVEVHTDSQFTLNSITSWIHRWKRGGWKTASGQSVKNKEDFMKLDECVQHFIDIRWVLEQGHAGVRGNEEADKLAKLGATRYKPKPN